MNAVEVALYTKLTGTAGITALLPSSTAVYNQEAPQGTVQPYVIFQQMSDTDLNRTQHRSKDLLYLAKGVSRTGFKQAGDIDAAIDAALHNTTLTVPGWTNYTTRRESSVRYLEPVAGGGSIYHAGGIYRLRITQ